MYLTNTPDVVYRDLQDGKRYEPIKQQIRLLLNEMISGVDAAVNPNAATLERKLVTSAGNYVADAADFNKLHVARIAGGDVTWNLSGLAFYKPYYFGADFNAGVVILDVGPDYHWRNVTPRDNFLDVKSAVRLRPGDVACVYRMTTNEYWIVGGYSRPSYTMLTDGGFGFFCRGPNGIWYGSWRRTLAVGLNTLTFSTAYGGAPNFQGAATRFTGFAPISATALSAAPIIRQTNTGAGTLSLFNDGAAAIEGMVNFWNLTE